MPTRTTSLLLALMLGSPLDGLSGPRRGPGLHDEGPGSVRIAREPLAAAWAEEGEPDGDPYGPWPEGGGGSDDRLEGPDGETYHDLFGVSRGPDGPGVRKGTGAGGEIEELERPAAQDRFVLPPPGNGPRLDGSLMGGPPGGHGSHRRPPMAVDLARPWEDQSPDTVVREVHRMRESELTLVEQIADQVAAMRLEQTRLQDQIAELRTDLERAKHGAVSPPVHHHRQSHRTESWWDRLSFQMPLAAAALAVMASGPLLTGI